MFWALCFPQASFFRRTPSWPGSGFKSGTPSRSGGIGKSAGVSPAGAESTAEAGSSPTSSTSGTGSGVALYRLMETVLMVPTAAVCGYSCRCAASIVLQPSTVSMIRQAHGMCRGAAVRCDDLLTFRPPDLYVIVAIVVHGVAALLPRLQARAALHKGSQLKRAPSFCRAHCNCPK